MENLAINHFASCDAKCFFVCTRDTLDGKELLKTTQSRLISHLINYIQIASLMQRYRLKLEFILRSDVWDCIAYDYLQAYCELSTE